MYDKLINSNILSIVLMDIAGVRNTINFKRPLIGHVNYIEYNTRYVADIFKIETLTSIVLKKIK